MFREGSDNFGKKPAMASKKITNPVILDTNYKFITITLCFITTIILYVISSIFLQLNGGFILKGW